MFDQISGHLGPAKLTHKINHYTWQIESHLTNMSSVLTQGHTHSADYTQGRVLNESYIRPHLILLISLMQVLLWSLLHSWGNLGPTTQFLDTCLLALRTLQQDYNIIYHTISFIIQMRDFWQPMGALFKLSQDKNLFRTFMDKSRYGHPNHTSSWYCWVPHTFL